jgi:hypothetical protein
LLLPSVAAYSIGISPDILVFSDDELNLKIFNPNIFPVNYTIQGCDFQFLEFVRHGMLDAESSRELIIRYNPMLNDNTTSCNMNVHFANNIYATAFTIPVEFPIDQNYFFSGFSPDNLHNQEKDFNYLLIISVVVALILTLFIIIKFF